MVQTTSWKSYCQSVKRELFGQLIRPYGCIDLGQHWLRWWLRAWQHQTITWTSVDLSSVRSNDINLRVISLEIPQPPVTKITLKNDLSKIDLKSHRGQWVKSYLFVFSSGRSLVRVRQPPSPSLFCNVWTHRCEKPKPWSCLPLGSWPARFRR